jgi:hypothetical protein
VRADTQYTLPRKRRKDVPAHRRVLSVRGAYRLAQKRSLGLGGGVLRSPCSVGPTGRRADGSSREVSERVSRFCRAGGGSCRGPCMLR